MPFRLYSTRRFGKGTDTKNDILIASAWPYANGLLHLGHLSGLIASDVLARYFRAQGHQVLFVSGSDSHGTPVVVQAEQEKTTPQEIAEKYHKLFKASFEKLYFSYDIYTETATENHQKIVQDIFLKLYESGHIVKKIQSLPYCEKCKRFLPDRYVEGTCPHCGFDGARGDQCDECGRLLDPDQLKDPKCKTCKSKPVWRKTEHFFLKLSDFEQDLTKWIEKSSCWRENAKQFSLSFLRQGLHERPITRDIEWGIPVPVDGYEDKKIYVWFEAVCGYYSACLEWAKTEERKKFVDRLWKKGGSRHYYVHGKDNIVFHSIIWPAILLGSLDLHLPDCIVSSEYLTIERKQFSKSRNWAIYVDDFLKKFKADTVRYYLEAYGPETSDADFSWDEFQERINKELIGNFANFIFRTLSLIKNNFGGKIGFIDSQNSAIVKKARATFTTAGDLIEKAHIREALKEVVGLAEAGNKFLSETKPWEKSVTKEEAEKILSECAYVIECLGILAAPFLPEGARKIRECLNTDADNWISPKPRVYNIKDINPLYDRAEDETIETEKAKFSNK